MNLYDFVTSSEKRQLFKFYNQRIFLLNSISFIQPFPIQDPLLTDEIEFLKKSFSISFCYENNSYKFDFVNVK